MTERRTPSGQGPSRRRAGADGRAVPARTRDTTARTRDTPSRARNTGPVRAPFARRTPRGSSSGGTAAERTDAHRPPALTSRATILIALVITLALAYTYPLRMYLEQESQIAEMKQSAAAQRAKIAETAKQLEKWHDPEYVRIMARQQYYVRPGETPLVVMGDEESAGSQVAEPAPAAAPDRWYDTLWSSVRAANTEQPSNAKPQD
ncbi:septum formation initiator family protein [Actinoplanes sp. NEAU-A12]|uniref:Septum formation initiator family protein n=1 Tax=Actinoplanes sandaracinus TaxID=3045177 RepID=A0ABT6WR44_9ACTN|nr:septum formation initiator family protein [Actinoplanes sandaracinus]MDI6102164.1 septum formation initiator family protein [Actinoplanes sandaracinus]